jgi:hypothetical protein
VVAGVDKDRDAHVILEVARGIDGQAPAPHQRQVGNERAATEGAAQVGEGVVLIAREGIQADEQPAFCAPVGCISAMLRAVLRVLPGLESAQVAGSMTRPTDGRRQRKEASVT